MPTRLIIATASALSLNARRTAGFSVMAKRSPLKKLAEMTPAAAVAAKNTRNAADKLNRKTKKTTQIH